MFDLHSLILVLAGTLVATLLQAGWKSFGIALASTGKLLGRKFNDEKARSELARHIGQIARDGLIRAFPHETGDKELDLATRAMVKDRSLDALLERHAHFRAKRAHTSQIAATVLRQAADLSPLLGLAGTLLSLGQLSTIAEEGSSVASAIGMAVTTTFYGVVIAHFLFIPLAGLIERRANAEDAKREELYRWLEDQVRMASPHHRHHTNQKKFHLHAEAMQ